MSRRTNALWKRLLAAEAPAMLSPELLDPGPNGRRARSRTPIWERARGSRVWDTEGRAYLDFAGGFGVAALGHAHPNVVRAVKKQASELIHGFGDVQPHASRIELADRLRRLLPRASYRALWAQSGSEAVELALKSAALATGRTGVLAFRGGYHGLTVGALRATGWPRLRKPFAPLLPSGTVWGPYAYCRRCPLGLRYPECRIECAREAFRLADRNRKPVGAVIVEPILGRGGNVVPPPEFLPRVAREAERRGWPLVVDEIFTGMGRTGRLLAHRASPGVRPDAILLGKALAGGLPLAVAMLGDRLADAWSRVESAGEAPHASTFLAHPLACRAALATLDTLRSESLPERARRTGSRARKRLDALRAELPRLYDVRGRGLLLGLEIVRSGPAARPDPEATAAVVTRALERGLLVLPGGTEGNVLSLTPALNVSERSLQKGIGILEASLRDELAP